MSDFDQGISFENAGVSIIVTKCAVVQLPEFKQVVTFIACGCGVCVYSTYA